MSMDNETNKKDTKVQNALNKLISDEWFAGQMYKQFIIAVDSVERSQIESQMTDTAIDELADHMKNLIDFAISYGFNVPATYNEMKKYADKDDVKTFETVKTGQSAIFYVKKAIESEKRAIQTYQKYVDDYEFAHDFQELKIIIQSNYFDEIDHLDNFEFIQKSLDAMESFDK